MVTECVVEIPLDAIQNNPWQTRPIAPEHRDRLAADIREHGLYQYPVGRVIDVKADDVLTVETVRRLHERDALPSATRYQLQLGIGHHRKAAYQHLAGNDARFATLSVKVRHLTDEEMADLAMLENDKRKDLNDIERARALQERKEDFGWSNAELGQRYDMARSTVSNLLRLLDLPARAKQAVQKHDISGRASSVLASAYGLPHVLQEAVAPNALLEAALGGVSGNELRRRMRRRIREHTVSLSDDTFPLDFPFDELAEAGEVVSAHCLPPGSHRRACPLLVELGRGGTDKRCPRRSCRDTKVDAWRRQQSVGQDDAESASDVDPDDHGHIDNRLGMDRHEVLDTADRGVGTTFVDDEEDVSVPPDVNEQEQYQDRHDVSLDVEQQIVKPAVEILADELEALNPKTLVVLYYKMQYGRPSESIDWTREQVLQAIAEKLVEFELPYDAKHNPSAALEAVSRLLRKVGAKLPWEAQEVSME